MNNFIPSVQSNHPTKQLRMETQNQRNFQENASDCENIIQGVDIVDENIIQGVDIVDDNNNDHYLYHNEYNNFLENLSIESLDNIESDNLSSDDDGHESATSNEDTSEDEMYNLKNELSYWYQDSSVTGEAMNKLLLVLREAGHSELPKSYRKLLNTPKKTIINSCSPGEYFHY